MTEIEKPQRILSKKLLVHGLIDLLDEVPYTQITITLLTKRADISRRTFYRHFKTIDELLDFLLQEIAKQFYEFQISQHPKNLKEIVLIYFTYWDTRKHFLEILQGNGLLYRLQTILDSQKTQKNSIKTNNSLVDYAIAFSSGAVWSLLIKWLEGGATQTPQDMSSIAHKILTHLSQD